MNTENKYAVSGDERMYLRELAKKQCEYSQLPVMSESVKEWKRHNSGKPGTPMIIVDVPVVAREEFLSPLKCRSPFAREMEKQLLYNIKGYESIGDDKVVPEYFLVPMNIWVRDGFSAPVTYAEDSAGRKIGYTWERPIKDLEHDLEKLTSWEYGADFEDTDARKSAAESVLGEILPVRVKNQHNLWVSLIGYVMHLMGMENMYVAMYDNPDGFHRLMRHTYDNLVRKLRWQEAEGLLTLNNGNDYAGSGSYGFTDELPVPGREAADRVFLKDLWLNINAQEAVGISPEMYDEFVAPYYQNIALEFGLVYYGCCEPVEKIWERSICKIPGLRKVSISPWCDEEAMGEALRGTGIVYCRKPNPNFLTLDTPLDEEAYAGHIRRSLAAARGCTMEISLRDLCTFGGQPEKAGQAVNIIRREIGKA